MLASQTIRYGTFLIIVGLAGYFLTGTPSLTALIPTAFGIPIWLCGVLARDERRRKHAMHFAALLTLIAIFGSVPGLVKLPRLLIGDGVARPGAVICQSLTAVASLWFFWLCLQSFIEARKKRAS